jgi:outer membrane protein
MKKILTLLVFTLCLIQANAQVNQELNKWILQSFTYYPRIQELNKTSEIADLRIDIAQSNYMPNVNGVASYNYINPISQSSIPVGPTEVKTLQFQPHNNYNLNVGLSQVIWDFGRTKAQVEKAKADLLASKQNTEAAKLQLATQVTSIYYSMIYLRKAIQLQDTVIAFFQQNKKIVESKIRQGDALQIDLANIENNIDQEKIRQTDFKRQYERQVALMTFTTGLNETPVNNEFDFQATVGQEGDTKSNPEFLAMDQRIAAAQAEARFAQNSRLPSLNFQAGAGVRNGYQPDIDKMRFNYLAGVSLNVPIFQGNRFRQNVAVTQRTVELNEISKANLNNTFQKDWQSAKADLHAYESQIKNTESQIRASRETLRLTQIRYERGVATYLDLIFASTNLQRALLTQLQYKYQTILALAELSRLQGNKFWQE